MKIEVLLFAELRESAGTDRLEVELPDAAKLADLRTHLEREFPATSAIMERSLFAVNERYADEQTSIPADSVVACIPPVSGG